MDDNVYVPIRINTVVNTACWSTGVSHPGRTTDPTTCMRKFSPNLRARFCSTQKLAMCRTLLVWSLGK